MVSHVKKIFTLHALIRTLGTHVPLDDFDIGEASSTSTEGESEGEFIPLVGWRLVISPNKMVDFLYRKYMSDYMYFAILLIISSYYQLLPCKDRVYPISET